MATADERAPGAAPRPPSPPPLPARMVDLRPLLMVGTLGWFVAFWVLLLTTTHDVWLWICLAGWVLGLLGFAIVRWQRSAARRGARGAQQGA